MRLSVRGQILQLTRASLVFLGVGSRFRGLQRAWAQPRIFRKLLLPTQGRQRANLLRYVVLVKVLLLGRVRKLRSERARFIPIRG